MMTWVRFGLQFRGIDVQHAIPLPENLLLSGGRLPFSRMCTGLNPRFNLWTQLAPYAAKLAGIDGEGSWKKWLDEIGKWPKS